MTEALDLLAGRPLVVLTGAGLSTDSGIPDYRGPNAPARMPMTYGEFVSGAPAQQRYWARSHIGWFRMARAVPNDGHRALSAMEAQGRVQLLITQNVDGLHQEAGSDPVALHGRISQVICLACRRTSSRAALQVRLEALNPGYAAAHGDALVRPDGDVELEETGDFVVPGCIACGGVLKPDVVFFGENVPAPRVQRCYDAVESLATVEGVLLVAGSSLSVMSGLRFVKRAAAHHVPVVILNRGATRGDDYAAYRLNTGCSDFLSALAALPVPGGARPGLRGA